MARRVQRVKDVRAFPLLQVKALDDAAGTFSGYLAVFGNEDLGGDVIQPGAFSKTLQDLKAKQQARGSRYLLPIFWGHDPQLPIGGFTDAREDSTGLFVVGELDLDIEPGQRAYSGLKKGYADGMSIGYYNMKPPTYKNGVRQLTELALIEGSLTPIPMNPEANVMNVKDQHGAASPEGQQPQSQRPPRPADYQDRKARDFDTLFQSLAAADDLQDEWGDTFIALVRAFSELMWQVQAQVNGWVSPDMPQVDAQEAAQATLDAFGKQVLDLVARSEAAAFAPSLDADGDQFLDPDGCNADEGDEMSMGLMSDSRPRQSKAGRVLSSANRDRMTKALDSIEQGHGMIATGHKDLKQLLADTEPSSDDDGHQDTPAAGEKRLDGAGAGAAPKTAGALAGNTTLDMDRVNSIVLEIKAAQAVAEMYALAQKGVA